MDDRRFDQLVKAAASGASRRSLLKGMLGLGGAVVAGGVALERDADAAKRPTPTPTPIRCPGRQTPVGGVCTCPGAVPNKCGPDCCTGKTTDPYPRLAGHSECCDNACCFGTCYGEELCCPTNLGAGGSGPLAEFCPGGPGSVSLCCTNGTSCCGGGTNQNECVDLSGDGCCSSGDCGLSEGACSVECVAGQCIPEYCYEGTICCQGECVSSSEFDACPTDPNGCCSREESEACCGAAGCCRGDLCNEIIGVCCSEGEQACGLGEDACCGAAETCCNRVCCGAGQCTTAFRCCAGSDVACGLDCCSADRCVEGQGCCPENYVACGGSCCSSSVYYCNDQEQCECLPGTEACSGLPGGCCPDGQCNASFECCAAGTTPCGDVCCDDASQTCNGQGVCQCGDGFLNCGGVCTAGECCDGDSTVCIAMGFDDQCVACSGGACATADYDYEYCNPGPGFCLNGQCLTCFNEAVPCFADTQCCSGTCNLETELCVRY